MLQRALGADRHRRLCVEILAPSTAERILDVGCGPAYILDYMPEVTYIGFDTEAKYIEYARHRYVGRGEFYCESFAEKHVKMLAPFDGAMLMGILHHLPDDGSQNLIELLSKVLKPDGRIVSLDPCFVENQSVLSRWVATHDRGKFVRDEEGYLNLVKPYFGKVQCRIFHNIGRIPSTEIVMQLAEPRPSKDH